MTLEHYRSEHYGSSMVGEPGALEASLSRDSSARWCVWVHDWGVCVTTQSYDEAEQEYSKQVARLCAVSGKGSVAEGLNVRELPR